MDALVAAVRALPLPANASSAAAAEDVLLEIDTARPQQSLQKQSQPPTPCFDAITADQQATVLPILQEVNAQFEAAFDLSSAVNASDKQLLLQSVEKSCGLCRRLFGTQTLLARVSNPVGTSAALRLLKILARTRTDLERTLYAPAFVRFLATSIAEEARARASDSSSSSSQGAPVLGDSVRLLLNMCIIQRKLVHDALLVAAPAQKEESKHDGADAAASSSSSASSPSSSSSSSPLCALVSSLPLLRNTASDRQVVFFFVRVLLFVLVEPRLAREAIQHAQLYPLLLQTVLDYSEGSRIGVDLAASASPSTSAASSSTSSTAAATCQEAFAVPSENRKVCMETFKLLTNLGVQSGSDYPSLHEVMTGGQQQSAASSTSSTSAAASSASSSSSKAELYSAFLDRLAALLRCTVPATLPPEVQEGYEGDPVVTEAVREAAVIHAAQAAERARIAALEAERAAAAEAAGQSADDASSSSASAAAALPAPAQIRIPRVQRQQTAAILASLDAERAAGPAGPNSASLAQVQRDLSTVLFGSSERSDMVPRLEDGGSCRPFHALVQLLHRQLVLNATDPAQKRDAEANLSPLLQVLTGLVRASASLRAHAKRAIFLELSRAPASEAVSAAAGPAVGANKKFDASNYAMMPAGALSEKVVDPDPLCLRSLLLGLVITLHFGLKQSVSDFLYAVVGDDSSEYIRLLGFGNAVGLLAEKGLPGFAGMLKSQKAVNIDEVMRSGRKL